MDPALVISEYKTTSQIFEIPLRDYERFEKFCGENTQDKKKLEIIPIDHNEQFERIKIKATSFVGIFPIPNNPPLIVQPKIGSKAFVRMLNYVETDNILFDEKLVKGLEKDSNSTFIDIFLRVYLKMILLLLYSNIRRGYNRVINNGPLLKGRINFAKTYIKQIQGFDCIVSEYFQFNLDTKINQALKYTLEHIQPIISPLLMPLYLESLQLLLKVNCKKFTIDDFDKIEYNNLTLSYRDVVQFSKLIVFNQLVSLNSGLSSFPAFCFNSWDFFEKFIRKILQNYLSFEYIIDKEKFQTENKAIIPDIYLRNRKSGKIDLVIDVKYKDEYKDDDYYRIHTYREELKAKKGILIYPQDIHHENLLNYVFDFFDFQKWMIDGIEYLRDFSYKIRENI